MAENHVWEFTNQRKLNKKEFLQYFEKKVFKTIRKHEMLPASKKIFLKDDGMLNTVVLRYVLEKKFSVSYGKEPNFASECLTDVSEEAFKNILKGDFYGLGSGDLKMPLIDLTDREIEMYAKLLDLKGKIKERDEKVEALFETFKKKNPDLDHNVVNAIEQIREVEE